MIAFRRGSMPEIVSDGTSGFLVDSVDEAIEAVGQLGGVNRASVRQWAENRFSAERMVNDYLELYQRILRPPSWPVDPS